MLSYADYQTKFAPHLVDKLALPLHTAKHELDYLASTALKIAPTTLLSKAKLSPADQDKITELVSQRLTGKPLAHVVGTEQFLDFHVTCTPDTLIPRPDTETLAVYAMELLAHQPQTQVADFGTGTGVLALAMAKANPNLIIDAYEGCPLAAQVAATNFAGHEQITVIPTSWEQANTTYDVIVSNPPYVTSAMCNLLELADPRPALDGGADGLDCFRSILAVAKNCLVAGGDLVFEHGVGQAHLIADLAHHAGFAVEQTKRDLAGFRRVLHLRRNA